MLSFSQFINEMAANIGNRSFSPIKDTPTGRYDIYNNHKNDPLVNKISSSILVHKSTNAVGDTNQTHYTTLDHDNKEALHQSIINHYPSNDKIPFEHETQEVVDRTNTNKLPKGYALDHIYRHFVNNNIPLKTSDGQYRKGHEMWRRLSNRALDDGHNVYHYDGNKFHKSNKENIESHLDNSFNPKQDKETNKEYQNRHMIISKTPIKNK